MATVDKNFKVKHGLIVEGTTATVNGEDIITTGNTTDDIAEGSANLYFTDERAAAAVADEIATAVDEAVGALGTNDIPETQEPNANLYFTDQRAQDAVAEALSNGTHTNITVTYDDEAHSISLTGSATADADIIDAVVADLQGLNETNYLVNEIKTATSSTENTGYKLVQRGMDGEFSAGMITADLTGDVTGTVSSLSNHDTDDVTEGATNLYFTNQRALDATASAYDASGAAATAESNANSYTDTAVSNLVNGAPALLDTLNELAAAINDDASFASTITTQIGEKQNALTAGSNIDITADTISVTGLDSADISDFNTAALSATASAYDAAGAASAAEQNAIDYADETFVTLTDLPGQLDDYVPTTEKGQALGIATLDASGYVPEAQLGNVPTAYITSVGDNLVVTDGVLDLGGSVEVQGTDYFALSLTTGYGTTGDFHGISRLGSAKANITAGTPVGFAFDGHTAKLLISAKSGSAVHTSEVLVAIDSFNENAYITEYASIATGSDLFSVDSVTFGESTEVMISSLSGQISVQVVTLAIFAN